MKTLYPLLLVFLLCLVSCVDKNEDPSPEDFMIGSWSYSSVVYNGKLIPVGFSEEYDVRWTFNSDGTYYRKLSYFSEDPFSFSEGTWQLKDNSTKVVIRDAKSGIEVVWDLVEAKENFLKVRVTTTSRFYNPTTVAEFGMIQTD